MKNINETIEYLNLAFLEKEKFLKKVNIPIIFYVAMQNRGEISSTDFAYKVKQFFKNVTGKYKEACSSGSAKAENVAIRVKELSNYIGQFLIDREQKEGFYENQEEISYIENDERDPTITTLCMLAKALQVPITDLFSCN